MARGRNTITQRIALDGGKEIEAELKALGAVGEEAFKRLKAAAEKVDVPTKFQQNLDKLKGSFADVGKSGQQLGDGLGRVRTSFTGLVGGLTAVTQGFTLARVAVAALVTGGMAMLITSAAESGDALIENAQKAGIAVKQFETLSFAAKTAGVGPEALGGALAKLNKALTTNGDLAKKTAGAFQPVKNTLERIKEGLDFTGVSVSRFGKEVDKAKDENLGFNQALRALGTSADELRKLDNEQRIIKIANGFARMEDGAEKSAVAMAVFGKSGTSLIPFLNMGSEGIQKIIDRMKLLGLTIGEDGAKALGDLADEVDFLNLGLTVTRNRIIAAFAPDIIRGSNAFLTFLANNRKAIDDFVATIRDQGLGTLKDFYNAFTGNGLAVNRPWVLEWAANIKKFGADVQAVIEGIILPKIRLFISVLDVVAKAMNAVFGTSFTGEQLAISLVITKMVAAFGLLGPSIGIVIGLLKGLGTALATFVIAPLAAAVGLPVALVAGIIAAIAALAVAIYAYWDEIKAGASTAWSAVADTITQKISEAAQGAAQTWANLSAGFDTAVAALTSVWDGFTSYLSSSWAALEAAPRQFAAFLGSALTGAVDLIKSAWGEAISFIQNSVSSVISAIQSVISSIRSAISAAANLAGIGGGGGGDSGEGFASGGYVRGPGTGTSDSIRAWLSNGEYVIRAAAVRKYGKQLLDALNTGRLKMPAFATGGLVSAPTFKQGLPAFASGGLVGSLESMFAGMMPQMALPSVASVAAPTINMGRPINLTIGGQTFSGLMAPEDVADRLARFAQGQALRSSGRKPGWAG